jgi:hypothetical protein
LNVQRIRVVVSLFVTVLLAASCRKSTPPLAPSEPSAPAGNAAVEPVPVPIPALLGPPGVLVGAGEIGLCGTKGDELTARLLDGIPGTVFTAGDNVYMKGTTEELRKDRPLQAKLASW